MRLKHGLDKVAGVLGAYVNLSLSRAFHKTRQNVVLSLREKLFVRILIDFDQRLSMECLLT